MDIVTLTAGSTLRYKLREKPHPQKSDDGFLVKAGSQIRILRETLPMFFAVDMTGKPTKNYSTK